MHGSGSFFLCMVLLIVFSQPPSALPPRFQTTACWSCDPALYRLRLELIRQLAEKDVHNFIYRSRSYPVILFTYAIFNHLSRSCCVCFRWPNFTMALIGLKWRSKRPDRLVISNPSTYMIFQTVFFKLYLKLPEGVS